MINIRKLAIAILVTSCSSVTISQVVPQNEKKVIADYINACLTRSYIENYIIKVTPRLKENYTWIEEIFKSNSIVEPIPYGFLDEKLKGAEFHDVAKVFLKKIRDRNDDLINRYEVLSLDSLLDLRIFSKTTIDAISEDRVSLRKEISDYLTGKYNGRLAESNTGKAGLPLKSQSDQRESTGLSTVRKPPIDMLKSILMILLLVAYAGVLVYLVISNYEIKNSIKDRDKGRSSYILEIKTNIQKLSQRISVLESGIVALQTKISNIQTETKERTHEPRPAEITEHVKTEVLNNVFYLSSFNEDGSFTHEALFNHYDKETVFYRFFIDENDNRKASFEFCGEDSALRYALGNPDKYLKPLCKIKNQIPFHTVTRIETEKKGQALRQNDIWVVDYESKAHIILI